MCVCALSAWVQTASYYAVKNYDMNEVSRCKQGRAAPVAVAFCTQRTFYHLWEEEADHLPVPVNTSLNS